MRNGQTYRTVRRKRARYLIGLSDVIAASGCPREKRERESEREGGANCDLLPLPAREVAFNLIPSSIARSRRRGERGLGARQFHNKNIKTWKKVGRIGGPIDPTVVPQSQDKLQHKHESERAHTYPWIFMQNC